MAVGKVEDPLDPFGLITGTVDRSRGSSLIALFDYRTFNRRGCEGGGADVGEVVAYHGPGAAANLVVCLPGLSTGMGLNLDCFIASGIVNWVSPGGFHFECTSSEVFKCGVIPSQEGSTKLKERTRRYQ